MDKATEELRRKVITGTDIAAIWGKSSRKTLVDVYMEKYHGCRINSTPRMQAGNKHERTIREEYEALTGIKAWVPPFAVSGRLGGSFDGLADESNPDKVSFELANGEIYTCNPHEVLMEFKCVNWDQAHHWGEAPYGDIYPDYRFQGQHYLGLFDEPYIEFYKEGELFKRIDNPGSKKEIHYMVMFGQSDFVLYIKKKEDKLIKASKLLANKFLTNFLDKGIMPPIDHSMRLTEYLKEKHNIYKQVMAKATLEMEEKGRRYVELNKQAASIEKEKAVIQNFFRFHIADNEGVESDILTCTLKNSGPSLDEKKLLQELMTNGTITDEMKAKYMKASSRRFNLNYKEK